MTSSHKNMLSYVLICFCLLALPFSIIVSFFLFLLLTLVINKIIPYFSYIYLIFVLPFIMTSRGLFISPKDDMFSYYYNFVDIYNGCLNCIFEYGSEIGLPLINKIATTFISIDNGYVLSYFYAVLQVSILVFLYKRFLNNNQVNNEGWLLVFFVSFLGWVTFTQVVRQSFSMLFVLMFFIEKNIVIKILSLIVAVFFHTTALLIVPLLIIMKKITLFKKNVFFIVFCSLIIFSFYFKNIYALSLEPFLPYLIKVKLSYFIYRVFDFNFLVITQFFHKIIIALILCVVFNRYEARRELLKSIMVVLLFVIFFEMIAYNSSERVFVIFISFIPGWFVYKSIINIDNYYIKIFLIFTIPVFYLFIKIIASDLSNPFSLFYGSDYITSEPFYYINRLLTAQSIGWR